MIACKRTVLTWEAAGELRRRIQDTGDYRVRALRRLHSSPYYEVIVDDHHTGDLFAVQSDDDWDRGVRRLVIEVDDLPSRGDDR